ncbi:alpha/beta hydrolase [Longibacter salinarum]|nr:alpha/beta hydrolase-fold protein [Longibacter salinarum]
MMVALSVSGCNEGRVAPTNGARLKVNVPDTLPDGAEIYVAGSFNDWEPGESEYRLKQTRDGLYEITLQEASPGPLQFKFTLGSWEYVEVDADRKEVGNRKIVVPEDRGVIYESTIAGWRNPERSWPYPNSTATGSVSVLGPAFEMAPLDRERRVWIYLPPDYETSERDYPVLYMHDGQNLFDKATSYAGEWGVDESLDSLHASGDPGIIVVGVDNGAELRSDEYSPWRNESVGAGGEGEDYVRFLVEELKPHIDSLYRTKPGPEHTGIMGSSMGGLISTYAMFEYPDVFRKAGIFSPAYWFASDIFDMAKSAPAPEPNTRWYVMSGALETAPGEPDSVYVRDHEKMIDLLKEAGYTSGVHLTSHIRADGKHAEWFWRREFSEAYHWLFRQPATAGK